MTRLFSLSIRTQLLLVVIILALPAALIIAYSGYRMRADALRDAGLETQKLSAAIASEQQNLVSGAEQLLVALAQLPDVRSHNSAKINPILSDILKLNSRYSTIFIADSSGMVWASSVSSAPVNVSDRRYFRDAIATGQFSSGEYVVGRITGRPIINFAYPFRNEQGAIAGIIGVGFDLNQYRAFLNGPKLMFGKGYLILDHQGVVLNTSSPEKFAGKRYDQGQFRKMQDGSDGDTVIERGMDGKKRLISYRILRLKGEKSPYMYIRVAIPLASVLSYVNTSLIRNMALFALAFFLALAFAWFVGRRSIVERIGLLEKASDQIAGGNLEVRVSDLVKGGELGSLSRTFDAMAQQLITREQELVRYRDHLEERVRERTTEISALNEQLRQSQKLEAVGLLDGGIAHDFSNILTTIKGSMYLIRRKLDKDSPLIKYVDQVQSSAHKANNLSQSLLAFSRRQAMVLRQVSLNDSIRKTAGLLSQLLGEHISLDLELTQESSSVMADSNQMEQILLNLATNARDAMPDGGRLSMQTSVILMDDKFIEKHGYGVAGRYVLLRVTDTGAGIEEGIKDKVFEPFFTTKGLVKGPGLGLAVPYGLVRQHNGYIDFDSAPGKGTTFRIYLPGTAETIPAEYEAREGEPAPSGTETILLAEDDIDTRKTISEVLRLSGYRVLEAKDGEEALAVYPEYREQIDMVFVDVRMPKKNGREVYEGILRLNPEVRFLFMSGYTNDIIDSQGILAEELNFISKAALPDEILEKIRAVLDK